MTYNVFSGILNPAESKLLAHASLQPKRHLNRLSRLCTDDRGVSVLLWSPYVIGQTIIFLPCDFYLSFFLLSFFLSSPNLSSRRLDVYRTSTHGVALVRIYDAGLKPAAGGSLEMQDAKKSPKIAIWAPSHNFVGLYLRN